MRVLRIIRIFRLFRINHYYDSLNVISEVLKSIKQQLVSSVFIIVMLMIASSLCMYSLEHEAQPEVFTNAFSGIWWAASTLLTVGYGENMHFINVPIVANDPWVGKRIADLDMPNGKMVLKEWGWLFSQVSSTRLLRSLSRCYATKALAVWRSAKYRQQKSHGLVSKLTSMTFSLSYLAKSLLHIEVFVELGWMRNLSHFSTFFTFHRDEVLDEVFWEYAASG